MISLQHITEDNFEDVLELKAQEEFVAPNSYSLAEAYNGLRKAVRKVNRIYMMCRMQ